MKTFTEEEVYRIVDAAICIDKRDKISQLHHERWYLHDCVKRVIREDSFNTLGFITEYECVFRPESDNKEKIESLLQQIRDLL